MLYDQFAFGSIIVSGQSTVAADAPADALTLVAGTNITITTNASTDTVTITCTASGLSGTGSTDNAVLRADGTGGSTLQASAIVIDDLYTSSPNATVNYVCVKPTGGTTNVGVAIVPKGTGAFSLAVPDGTSTGGNARGASAVDLQTSRSAATQVASGTNSVSIGVLNTASNVQAISIGYNNAVSGVDGIGIGYQNSVSSGDDSGAFGLRNTVNGYQNYAFGSNNTVSGTSDSFAFGSSCTSSGTFGATATGYQSSATRYAMRAHAAGRFSVTGDVQQVEFQLRNKTTNATPTTLFLDGSSTRLTIPSGKILTAKVLIQGAKSDGSAVAVYRRLITIKNVSGTTTLVNSQTLATDYEDNASTDVAITADDTNDALQINVTGITGETWRWHAVVTVASELAYGT